MDIVKKNIIYSNGFFKLYRLASLYNHNINQYHDIDSNLDNIFSKIQNEYNISYKDIINLRISDYKKFKRIKNRILNMNQDNIWFCTWTISDDNLNRNHKRILKDLYSGLNYVINVDYGKNTNRKHYHGIIESVNMPVKWSLGFCKFVKVDFKNVDNISKYINKFSNHAIKDTTLSNERIIYSRKKSAH